MTVSDGFSFDEVGFTHSYHTDSQHVLLFDLKRLHASQPTTPVFPPAAAWPNVTGGLLHFPRRKSAFIGYDSRIYGSSGSPEHGFRTTLCLIG